MLKRFKVMSNSDENYELFYILKKKNILKLY
jgi:hypothetical protein